jgi:hypothetical protein
MDFERKSNKDTLAVPEFPGTRPKPDEMKTYIDALEDVAATRGLAPAINGSIPERVASKELNKYTRAELVVLALPADATYSDKVKHADLVLKVEGYKKKNAVIDSEILRATMEDRNELFGLMASSMSRSNPGLRDALRLKFRIKDKNGMYDGFKALQFVKEKMNEQAEEGAFYRARQGTC